MKRSRWLCAPLFGAFAMSSIPPIGYHIYCDEFGDQALKHTASEWFIVSAIVVATHREPHLTDWIDRIKRPMKNQQRPGLHFTDLNESMKLRSTRFLGKLPVRCFALLSHKRNMINYKNYKCESWYRWHEDSEVNDNIAKRHQKNAYSNFVLKILLERATGWCERRSMIDHGSKVPVAITIAQRGGFYLDSFLAYLDRDYRNWRTRSGTLPGYLAWPVVNPKNIITAPAANVAGLQLADIVAGSFSRAIDEARFGSCDRRFVTNLKPRVALKHRSAAGFGLTGLPWELSRVVMSDEQQRLFRMFGYGRRTLVRPGPILPRG
jgi:Protein of unknown function (DUF3800)